MWRDITSTPSNYFADIPSAGLAAFVGFLLRSYVTTRNNGAVGDKNGVPMGEVLAEACLKRRRLALDYFCQIPDEKVTLQHYVNGRGNPAAEHQHLHSEGLDALQCGTMACLAGWLWTMPEYRDWCRERGIKITNAFNTSQYLGCPRSAGIFCRRCNGVDGPAALCRDVTDKTLALRRLEKLVGESEREVPLVPTFRNYAS